MFVKGKSRTIFFPADTLIYGISLDGYKDFNMRTCEHMILGQLRMGVRQAKNAPLSTPCHLFIISPPSWPRQFENEENCQNMSSPVKAFKSMRLFKRATVACGPCELGAESLDNMGEGSQSPARSLEMPLSLLAAVHNPTKNIGLRQFHQFLIT